MTAQRPSMSAPYVLRITQHGAGRFPAQISNSVAGLMALQHVTIQLTGQRSSTKAPGLGQSHSAHRAKKTVKDGAYTPSARLVNSMGA